MSSPVYPIQAVVKPAVKPVWQPVVSYIQTFNRLSNPFDNRFDNRLYRVYSRLSNRLYNRLYNRFDNRLCRVNGVSELSRPMINHSRDTVSTTVCKNSLITDLFVTENLRKEQLNLSSV